MADSESRPQVSTILGHPTGLFVLFFTEMWERFSYYGMRAILVLYMSASATAKNAGMGWTEDNALALYGWYTMLVYVMSIPGGIIADKFIGQKKAVLYGGLLLVAGHSVLAIEQNWAFFTGLALIVLGVGGLKPNISTMVGGLYPEGDIRRDKGFTIFYIGINIGAAFASILVGWIGETFGWHYGFGLAGIGMLLGQLVFMLGGSHLKGIGEKPIKEPEGKDSLGHLFKKLFSSGFPRLGFGLVFSLGLVLVALGLSKEDGGYLGYGLLLLFLSFVVGLLMVIYQELTKVEKDKYVVLLLSFLIVIVFWGAFEQAGGLMNLYTKAKVDRTVLGYEIPASTFQAVNAIFIILFGTLVAGFWAWRKRKKKESSSLFKMAIGTIIMGSGFLFMAKASLEVLSTGQAALVWILLAYLFHTLGELSASPVALSFITKLAPAKYGSIMMGVYFAATGLGNKVAGAIGEMSRTPQAELKVAEAPVHLGQLVADSTVAKAQNFEVRGRIYLNAAQEPVIEDLEGRSLLAQDVLADSTADALLKKTLASEDHSPEAPLRVDLSFENKKDQLALQEDTNHVGQLGNYSAKAAVFEVENKKELQTFIGITGFTLLFGLLLILFLKKLKSLTHGVEERES